MRPVYKIKVRRRMIGDTPVCDPVMRAHGVEVVCDEHLRGDLARLVPDGWGNAKPAQWHPFYCKCVALGLF